jgi:hypothetical protein
MLAGFRRLLGASPYQPAWFQGEGVRLYRKDTEGDAGFVDHLGECNQREAEDEIIRRWFEAGGV